VGHGFTKTGERVLHEGYVITLATATFEGPAGEVMERDVVHHPGAVAVVAVDGGEVVLVRQYPPVMEREMLEIPANRLPAASSNASGPMCRKYHHDGGKKCHHPFAQ